MNLPRPPGPAPAWLAVPVAALVFCVVWWPARGGAAATPWNALFAAALAGAAVLLGAAATARRVDTMRRRNMAIFERAPFCVYFQTDGRIVNINNAGARMYGGRDPADLIGTPILDLVHPDDRGGIARRLAEAAGGRTDLPTLRSRGIRLDGREITADAVTFPFEIDGVPSTLTLIRDVSAEVEAQRQATRLAHLYAALSKTNEAIFRETDRAALCAAVCRIAVEHGGLVAASIRRHVPADGTLVVEASHGPRAAAPGRRTIGLADAPPSLVRVLREGRPFIANDVAADPGLAPLARHPHYAGVRATAVFPLDADGVIGGTFSVHADQTGYFDDALTALLEEMARNLAFGFARLAAADERRRMEGRYRQLFDHVPTAILVHAGGRIVMCNPAALQVFAAADASDLVGREVLDLVRAQSHGVARAAIDDALAAGGGYARMSGTLLRTDGTAFDARLGWMPIDLDGGRAVLVMIDDISVEVAARRRAGHLARMYTVLGRTNAAVMRESNRDLLCAEVCRIAVEEGGLLSAALRLEGEDGLWTRIANHGPTQGRIDEPLVKLGPAVVAALMADARHVINDAAADPGLAHLAHDIAQLGIGAGALFRFEAEPGVAGLFVVYASTPGFFDDDLCALLQEIVHDLAFAFAKLRADAALRDNEERYRLLFASSPAGLFVTVDDHVVMLNPAGRQLLRAADDSTILGRSLYEFVRPDYSASVGERIRAVSQAGRPVPPLERVLMRADGTEFDAEVTTLPFIFGGRPAMQFIVNDLTERKAAERALRDINTELEARVETRTAELRQANQELRDFSYIVSHDLKAPLRGIASLVDWLKTDHAGALGESGRELLDLMSVRARRMHRMIEDILRYSRVGRGRDQAGMVDLAEVLAAVEGALEIPAGIELRVEGPLPVVRGARTDLEQVLQNLLANAIRYMGKPQGLITVDCAAEPGFWRIGVADNGPGIDPKHHKRIFELFQRLGPKDDSDSTGIGLTIVKKIVEGFGGTIEVSSTPGQGSRFCFTLPRSGAAPAAADPPGIP